MKRMVLLKPALKITPAEMLGVPFGWRRGDGDWVAVNAAVTRGDVVQVIQEAGCPLWQKNLPAEHPFEFGVSPKVKAKVWITAKVPHFLSSQIPEVYWHPRVLWVGIGFQRGTSRHLLEAAIEHIFREHQLAQQAIAKIVTIDTKAEEVGLAELCQKRQWALKTFAAEVLRSISVPHPSPIVEKEAGTPSVAEAAAICGAFSDTASEALQNFIPKQIFRRPTQTGAVTVAVAQAEIEYIELSH